jgi:hypothetical protein
MPPRTPTPNMIMEQTKLGEGPNTKNSVPNHGTSSSPPAQIYKNNTSDDYDEAYDTYTSTEEPEMNLLSFCLPQPTSRYVHHQQYSDSSLEEEEDDDDDEGYSTSMEYFDALTSLDSPMESSTRSVPTATTMTHITKKMTPPTPRQRNHTRKPPRFRRSHSEGIQIDPMMEKFLGLGFLPFESSTIPTTTVTTTIANPTPTSNSSRTNSNNDKHNSVSRDVNNHPVPSNNFSTSSPSVNHTEYGFEIRSNSYDDYSNDPENDTDYYQLVKDDSLHSSRGTNLQEGRKVSSRKQRKLAKRVRALSNSSVTTGTPKIKNKSSRCNSNQTVEKDNNNDDALLLQSVYQSVHEQMDRIDMDKKRLKEIKSQLRSIQTDTRKVMVESQKSSQRLNKLSKHVSELESKLNVVFHALEKEESLLQSKNSLIATYEEKKMVLENEYKQIDANIQCRSNYIQQLTPRSSNSTSLRLRLHSMESSISVNESNAAARLLSPPSLSDLSIPEYPVSLTSTRRLRTTSDISYLTADEPLSPCISSIRSNSTLSSLEYNVASSCLPPRIPVKDQVEEKSVIPAQGTVSSDITATKKEEEEDEPSSSNWGNLLLRINDLEDTSKTNPQLFSLSGQDYSYAINLLVRHSVKHATDESSRWSPDRTTQKILSRGGGSTNTTHPVQGWNAVKSIEDILVWSGKFDHDGYGSELPAVKARGLVATSPRELVSMLIDSSCVKTYNKMSLGRTDECFLQSGLDTISRCKSFRGEAKIVRSLSSIPLVRKQVELLSLLHARSLDPESDGMKGFISVTRSVWEDEDVVPPNGGKSDRSNDYIRSEMLLGVNLIRELDGDLANYCELTTVTHFITPGIPTIGAKQIAMKAATNFIKEIQRQFE